MFIDFQAVKASVPIESILSHYNTQLRRVNQVSLRGDCPFPTHVTKNEGSFSVHTSKNCFACHSSSCMKARGGKTGGNILDFVSAMEGCTIRESAEKIAGWFAINGKPESKPETKPEIMPETTTAPPETASEENKPLAFTLKSEYCEYLKGRGLTEDTCKLFGVGLCASKGSMAGRVVIPIHNPKAELVAYIGRAVDGSEPKFKIPAGFHMSRELFNYHRAGGKVVTIVEGPFDCLHLTQNGYPNVVALLGKSLSDSQAELICTKWKGATLMLDGDTAGSEASEKITLALSKRIYVRRIELERGKDPDNYDKASLERLMK